MNEVSFAFERPSFAQEYSAIFLANAFFLRARLFHFSKMILALCSPVARLSWTIFENAPRDWIFTRSREHT